MMDSNCRPRGQMAGFEKPAASRQEFIFVTADPKLKDTSLSTIRAHVTRQQHLKRREANRFRFMNGKLASSATLTKTFKGIPPINGGHNGTKTDRSATEIHTGDIGTSILPKRGTVFHKFMTGAAGVQVFQLLDSDNIVGTCFNDMTTDLTGVMDMFATVCDSHNDELLDRIRQPLEPRHPSLRRDLMPFVYTHPALYAAGLLTAASLMIVARGENPSRSFPLLKLRGFAMDKIQSYIELAPENSPKECISDALITAVSLMAKYEASFGTASNHNVHMQGLVRMVNMRGGLDKLGLGGLLADIVLWFDNSTADILDTLPFYPQKVKILPIPALNMMTGAALAPSDRPV